MSKNNLIEVLLTVKPVNSKAAKDCTARFDNIAKPVGSLGAFEQLLAQIAAITGSPEIDISKKAVVVFCADNGVVRRGVAMHDHEVTTAVAGMLNRGKSGVSAMAAACGADVFTFDIGMVDMVEGICNRKLMSGTNDITEGPAMSSSTAVKAIETGIDTVKNLAEKGYRLIATGETGIGNTTTSSAVCSALLSRPAREVTGRGAGLDDAGLYRKVIAIEQAIELNRPDASDPIDVLSKVGGLDIAALCGVFLGGALYRIPIVIDGFISGVAALLAVRLCRDVRGYMLPSHESDEPGARLLNEELGTLPVIKAGMRLGEGTGAVMLFPLLDMTLAVYRNTATYVDIQVNRDGGID